MGVRRYGHSEVGHRSSCSHGPQVASRSFHSAGRFRINGVPVRIDRSLRQDHLYISRERSRLAPRRPDQHAEPARFATRVRRWPRRFQDHHAEQTPYELSSDRVEQGMRSSFLGRATARIDLFEKPKSGTWVNPECPTGKIGIGNVRQELQSWCRVGSRNPTGSPSP